MIKYGDQLMCINNGEWENELTNGRTYKALSTEIEGDVVVLDNNGILRVKFANRFKVVE